SPPFGMMSRSAANPGKSSAQRSRSAVGAWTRTSFVAFGRIAARIRCRRRTLATICSADTPGLRCYVELADPLRRPREPIGDLREELDVLGLRHELSDARGDGALGGEHLPQRRVALAPPPELELQPLRLEPSLHEPGSLPESCGKLWIA